jgi:multiple sugar transport system substrate-binding protein
MKKIFQKNLLLLLVITMILFVLLSEIGLSQEIVKLVLWHQESPPPRVEAFQKIIDRFNAEHPEIQVKQAPQSWTEIYPKLYAAIEAGNPPDILFSIPDLTMAMKLTGAVTPVEDIVNEIDSKYDMLDSQIAPYDYDGHIWAVPMFGMTYLLLFNKGVFDKEGISYPFNSWNELLDAVKKLTKNGKFGFGFPASQLMMTDQYVYSFMVTNNCEIFDNDGNVTLDSQKCVESFAFIDQLIDYSPPNVVTWSWGDRGMYFLSENTYMMEDFLVPTDPMEAEKEGKGPFGFMRIPYPEGGKYGSPSYSNGATVFTKDPTRLEAIKTFLLYLHEPEINGELLSNMYAGLYLPITKASMESKSFWSNEIIERYKDDVKLAFAATADGKLFGFEYAPQPVIGRIAGDNLLGQMAGKLATNQMTAEEVVKWGADKIRAWQEEME